MRFYHRFPALARSGRIVGAILAIAASLAATGAAAGARDRPGTPDNVSAGNCINDITHAKRVCAYFTNTAHEDVKIEWESTRNGAPASLDAVYCPPDAKKVTRTDCFTSVAGVLHAHSTSNGPFAEHKEYSEPVRYGMMTNDVDFGTTYCLRFRARRTSDQVVSENWSAWACTTTPPVPPKPSLPNFAVTYQGSQPAPHATAAVGQSVRIVPQTMQVAPVADTAVAEYDLAILPVEGSQTIYSDARQNFGAVQPFVYKIDTAAEAVTVRVCAVNFSGKTCASQIQSISRGGAIGLPTPPGGVALHVISTPTPLPIRLTGVATAPVRLSSELFMVGFDRPGSDYRHDAIAGVAEDCQKRCQLDGNCLVWTWVKPGVQNAQAMCWLKNAVPPAVQNANTTSGIVNRSSTIVK